ncbi:TadE/TadG family type IV pilus assembly protein [Streptomyces crystallinus]|uniref:TadE-like domain-containing protein n=1 Tax=Streptomyces crystallinus TaxID=68191 RepID=A0ABP3Q5V7_9ACTN
MNVPGTGVAGAGAGSTGAGVRGTGAGATEAGAGPTGADVAGAGVEPTGAGVTGAGAGPRRAGRLRRLRAGGRDRGSAAVEYLGFLPLLLLVALAGVQLGLAAYAAQQAGTAARAAARTGAQSERSAGAAQAGKAAVSDWVGKRADIGVAGCPGSTVTATVTVSIPSVFPGIGDFGPVHKSATMPCDDSD